MRRTSYQIPVAEVTCETAQACSVVLDVPAGLARAFAYRPGQFVTVRVPARGGSVARCYSMSSSPESGDRPAITVKRVPSGYASNWIADHVGPGSVLELLPPAGTFTPRTLDADFLLFAAGSGITPVISIAKSALAVGSGRIVLVYANADPGSVIFGGRLRELQASWPARLTVVHWLDVLQGEPGQAALRELARPYAAFEAYVCGPDPYMAVVRRALAELKVPASRTHVERFVSLADNPFEPAAAAEGMAATLRVSLDDEERTLDWPAGERMLDVLIAAGLDAPYSCREGICGACTCRLDSGQVQMAHNEVLEESDLQQGYVLACQSLAASAEISISYG